VGKDGTVGRDEATVHFELISMLIPFEKQEAQECIDTMEQMEFPQCGMRHEDLVRNPRGLPILDDRDMCEYLPQCPSDITEWRPACAHFIDGRRGISRALELIKTAGLQTIFVDLQERYHRLHAEIKVIDNEMRDARCGDSLYSFSYHPSPEQAVVATKDLVKTHATFVEQMQRIVGEITAALRALLEQE
jgi:hypothetical protein